MNLKKLPPSMVMLLGLGPQGCIPCLSCLDDGGVGLESSGTDSGRTSTTSASTGPCLSPPFETTTNSATGPVVTETSTGADSGTGTGTDMGSGTDGSTGTGSGTATDGGTDTSTGPCLAPPGVAPDGVPTEVVAPTEAPTASADSRRAVLERVLSRDALPADVASRLRSTLDD